MLRWGFLRSGTARPWFARVLLALLAVLVAGAPQAIPAPMAVSLQSWQTEQGLPDDTITAIAQTPGGHVWAGTARGLARFDGLKFEAMRGDRGVEEGPVSQLFVDRSGALWVSMKSGVLLRSMNGRFLAFGKDAGWSNAVVRSFASQDDGGVLLSTVDGEVRRHHDGRFRLVLPAVAGAGGTGVMVDQWGDGTIWLRRGRMVGRWRNGAWDEVEPGDRVPPLRLGPMTPRRAGGVWLFAAERRLELLQGGEWRTSARSYPSFMDPSCLLEDAAGCLWIGTSMQGLVRLDPNGDVQRYFTGTGFPGDHVNCLFEDRDGNIWVGTDGAGLIRLYRQDFVVVEPMGIPRTSPLGLVEDASGGKWVSFAEAGLYRLAGTNVVRVPPAMDRTAWAVAAGRDGVIWSGVYGIGLAAWQAGTNRVWTAREKLPSNDIRAMVVDPSGALWIASMLGVATFDGTNFVDLMQRHGLRAREALCLAMDGAGAVWAGMRYGGLIRFQDGRADVFTTTNGLPSNHVRALLPDGDGALWIGTAAGLCRFQEGRLQAIGPQPGLPAREINGMVADDAGHLWLGMTHGIVRVSRDELLAVAGGRATGLGVRTFGVEDGLPSARLTRGSPSAIRARDGRLWFTTLKGLAAVNPADLRPMPLPGPVVIEEVRVDGRTVGASIDGRGWSERPLEIAPGPRRIEVRYSSANFHTPERLQFKWRLEGREEDWQAATRERSVVYHGLGPGWYRLHVAVAEAGKGAGAEDATLAFVVQPWFWETVWFRVAGALLGVLGLGGAFRLRTRSLERRRKAQELFSRQLIDRQEAERQRIAAELHDSLGQSLAVVKNLAILGQRGVGREAAPADARLEEISTAASLALDEMHAISYALRPPELDRLGLARALEGMIRRVEEATSIRFTHHLELDGAALPAGTEIHLFRIAQEAVSNVMKHSGAATARLELWKDEAGVHLVVADDGRGFVIGAEGAKAGLGLSGIVERVHLLGGRHELTSRPGHGTTLSVLIPGATPSR